MFTLVPMTLEVTWHAWVVLLAIVVGGITLDLFVHRKKHEAQSIKQAALMTLMWVSIGAATGVAIWSLYGAQHGAEYFSAWIIEYSLSVDNIFAWSVVFTFFAVPQQHRHRLLFWGVFGALVMRAIFITGGVALIHNFEWVMIILGGVLIWSAIKVARSGDDDEDVSNTKAYKFFTRVLPLAKEKNYEHFFIIEAGKRVVTIAFLALLMVEVTDLIFAVNSVPAVLAISSSAFIIYASNAMAIMGLRSLYFVFDAIKDKFSWLNVGLAIILAGIGVKMILANDSSIFGWFQMPGWHVPTTWSLAFIGSVLALSMIASLVFPKKEDKTPEVTQA